jgi:hypothetical protein
MPRPIEYTRYTDLIRRAESHYERQGFVKWADLAAEIGVSRQRVLQMMQQAVGYNLLTGSDIARYRSPSSRLAVARANAEYRRDLEKQRISVVVLPENYAWLEGATQSAPPGTTRSDLINAAINHYRKHINA